MNIIMEKIEARLKEMGKKPIELCRAIGINSSTYSTWKNKGRSPNTDKMQDIAQFLGVPVEYLLNADQPTVVIDRSGSMNVDISKELNHALELLSTDNALYFDGEPMSEDTYELLKSAMEIMLTSAKKMSKK